jgi:hypothetical protein
MNLGRSPEFGSGVANYLSGVNFGFGGSPTNAAGYGKIVQWLLWNNSISHLTQSPFGT